MRAGAAVLGFVPAGAGGEAGVELRAGDGVVGVRVDAGARFGGGLGLAVPGAPGGDEGVGDGVLEGERIGRV